MQKELTIEHAVWLYAAGCVEKLLADTELAQSDYEYAVTCIKTGVVPDSAFIRRCFHRPFAMASTAEEMLAYWRSEHMSYAEKTPVYRAWLYRHEEVPTWPHGTFYRVQIEKPRKDEYASRLVRNVHGYNLQVADWVFVHGSVIAEPILLGPPD